MIKKTFQGTDLVKPPEKEPVEIKITFRGKDNLVRTRFSSERHVAHNLMSISVDYGDKTSDITITNLKTGIAFRWNGRGWVRVKNGLAQNPLISSEEIIKLRKLWEKSVKGSGFKVPTIGWKKEGIEMSVKVVNDKQAQKK